MLNWGYAFMTLAFLCAVGSAITERTSGRLYAESIFIADLAGIAIACVAAAKYLGG